MFNNYNILYLLNYFEKLISHLPSNLTFNYFSAKNYASYFYLTCLLSINQKAILFISKWFLTTQSADQNCQ